MEVGLHIFRHGRTVFVFLLQVADADLMVAPVQTCFQALSEDMHFTWDEDAGKRRLLPPESVLALRQNAISRKHRPV